MDIQQQLDQVRTVMSGIERSLERKRKFEPREIELNPAVDDFNVELAGGFATQEVSASNSLFDISIVPMEIGGFGIDMSHGHEFSVGVAEVTMELAAIGTNEVEGAGIENGASFEIEGSEFGESEAGEGAENE